MIIKKYTGKTEKDATEKAREELGPAAVVMNVKPVSRGGLKGLFRKQTYEVTAAVEEDRLPGANVSSNTSSNTKTSRTQSAKPSEAKSPVSVSVPKPSLKKTLNVNASVNAYREQTRSSAQGAEKHLSQAGGMTREESVKRSDEFIQKRAISGKDASSHGDIEERIDALQQFLEDRFKDQESQKQKEVDLDPSKDQRMAVMRMLYRTLIAGEVDEHYVNSFIEEISKTVTPSSGLDSILANAYQKLILKFGSKAPVTVGTKRPKVVFFIGPTGVGKTTTIAKIASKFKVEEHRNIALATSDTYRIAATDQLQIYADILDIPMVVVYTADELNKMVAELRSFDLILVDTAGFSHKNDAQKSELATLVNGLDSSFDKEIYLVVSAATKYKDLLDITDSYRQISDYRLIFTKLDETSCYGNLLNIRLHTDSDISYVTTGQNVPDDIEVFDAQKIVKQLLGGN